MARNEIGIKRTENGEVLCECCGGDLSKPEATRFTVHLDGDTFYENRFVCTKCGNPLIQRYDRSPDWWTNEEE